MSNKSKPPSSLLSASRGAAARLQGSALEDRVASAFSRAGHPVTRNVILVDSHGLRSEIDIVVGPAWWWPFARRVFIECKAYQTSGASVGLEDVAKFKEVLARNRLSPTLGLFVTTTTYVPRARSTGIRTLDGNEWVAMERRLRAIGRLIHVGPRVFLAACVAAVATAGLSAGSNTEAFALFVDDARSGWREGLAGSNAPRALQQPPPPPPPPSRSWWDFSPRGRTPPPQEVKPVRRESQVANLSRAAGDFARQLGF